MPSQPRGGANGKPAQTSIGPVSLKVEVWVDTVVEGRKIGSKPEGFLPLARPYLCLSSRNTRPWLRADRLFGEMRLPKDSAAGRREFERQLERRRRQEGGGEEWAAIRRGWFFGADALKWELLALVSKRVGTQHYGAERQESGEAKAERLVGQELQKRGWTEEELAQRRKGDPDKVRIARRLRQETTMTLAWIAARLQMGVWTHVSNLLRAE